MGKWIVLLTALGVVVGCTRQVSPLPVGGSRADGTVELAYDFGAFDNPQVDFAAAQIQAEQRCAAWGYSGAEKFGGEKRLCTAPSSSGCLGFQVTMNYQCTGAGPQQ